MKILTLISLIILLNFSLAKDVIADVIPQIRDGKAGTYNIELDDKKIDKDEEQLDTPDPIITGKYNGGVHDFGPMTYLVPLIVPPYSNSYSNFYLEQNKLIKEQTDAIISLSKKIDKFEDRLQDLEEKL